MTKKIIVTGGAGFIGSHLVDLLLADNHTVLVIDNFSYGKREFLNTNNPLLTICEGDITNKDFITESIRAFEPEIIFHLAALHHIPTCENMPDVALKINIEGTQHILNAASNLNSLRQIVFASSGAVYDIVDTPLLENSTPTIPYDVYSVSKLSGEYLLRLWANKYNKKAVVARIFNTIGGRETNAHLVPEIIEQLLDGKDTVELGNLEPLRSYIDTRDTSSGIYAISKVNLDNNFEVFNIGREDEFNVKEIVELLSASYGAEIKIVQSPARMRKVDRVKQQASLLKTQQLIGWSPKFSVKDGLGYAYQFALERRKNEK
jgi:UDP-glucose 4-epimerase